MKNRKARSKKNIILLNIDYRLEQISYCLDMLMNMKYYKKMKIL